MTLKSKTGFYVFSDMILGDMPIIYSGRGLQMTGALGGSISFSLLKTFSIQDFQKLLLKVKFDLL